MELNDKIVNASIGLFFEKGLKAVSMDDVAKAVGISKRTLYETFESKDTLVVACLDKVQKEREDRMRELMNDSESFIDLMMQCLFEAMGFLQSINPVFFADLDRFNYCLVKERLEERVTGYRNRIIELIEKGKADGLLRTEVDSHLIANVIIGGQQKNGIKEIMDGGNWTLTHVLRQMAAVFLRGMATEKGIRLIDDRLATLFKQENTKTEK